MEIFIDHHPIVTFFIALSVMYTVRVIVRGYPKAHAPENNE